MAAPEHEFVWTFQKLGAFTQAQLRSGEAIRRLRELDPKLWVALSCPARGLEFDQRTLSLLDANRDNRIRIPEIIEAAEWLCARLKDPAVIIDPREAMPLDVIVDGTETGRRLVATGRAILERLGKAGAEGLSQEDVTEAALHASEQMFNGDGVLPPLEGLDDDMRDFIRDAISVAGGIRDVNDQIGLNKEIAAAFIAILESWRQWNGTVCKTETPLGAHTAECWQLLTELKPKIDDYFLRCELIAYAPDARGALNQEGKTLAEQTGLLNAEVLAGLPLAKAEAERPLSLGSGLNPAWRRKVERFAALSRPLLPAPDTLTRDDWRNLQTALAPFGQATAAKPTPVPAPGVTAAPVQTVDMLGEERITRILDSDLLNRFNQLAEQDLNGPAASVSIVEMERLVLYYRHFYRLLTNYVNFEEFYDTDKTAAFQSGRLYIDGRSCHLCMPAENVEAHSAIADDSQLFLLYCSCTRGLKPGTTEPEKKQIIVAAVTAGDSDLLVQNRNGVYVDNHGDDWDATVIKVIPNPIDLWQAAWTPYKRIGNLITEQLSKYANAKEADVLTTAGKTLDEVGGTVTTGSAPKFDIGRNVGIFAAVGLALGAIGTAVGSMATAVLAMSWWQLPLLVLGLFLVISGPSVFLAWLKLRRRTLGPLLEASGWAINGRVTLPYTVARSLSATAEIPDHLRRNEADRRTRRVRSTVFWLAIAAGALLALAWLGLRYWREQERRDEVRQTQMRSAPPDRPETPREAPSVPQDAEDAPEPLAYSAHLHLIDAMDAFPGGLDETCRDGNENVAVKAF